jgi:hypothetical protein
MDDTKQKDLSKTIYYLIKNTGMSYTNAIEFLKIEIKNYFKEDFINLMDSTFKNRTLTVLTDENYRGLGKTVYLINKAKELDCTLFVPRHQVDMIKRTDSEVKVVGIGEFFEHYRGARCTNGFIVDEGLSIECIKFLKQYYGEFLGGIASLNYNL